MTRNKKQPWLVLIPILITATFAAILVGPSLTRIMAPAAPARDPLLEEVPVQGQDRFSAQEPAGAPIALQWTCVTIWLVALWWTAHHLSFQVSALFFPAAKPGDTTQRRHTTRFVILYLTRDDFQPASCASCLSQDYPAENFRVLIGDDSDSPDYRRQIDAFVARYPQARLSRRRSRRGFKAGNINFALRTATTKQDEWIVLVDADQLLPPDYLQRLGEVAAGLPEEVGFIQGGHDPLIGRPKAGAPIWAGVEKSTLFQEVFAPGVMQFYERDVALREPFGFLPFIGHGGAIRRETWAKVSKIPRVVSEDFAFSFQARRRGILGTYAPAVKSWEAFPQDFAAFVVRLRKFAGGTAELVGRYWLPFVCGRGRQGDVIGLAERLDALVLLGGYGLMCVFTTNVYLTGWVCHVNWRALYPVHPVLPYLFLLPMLLGLSVTLSVIRKPLDALQYWFWSSAVYTAATPVGIVSFIRHLFRRPTFERTPKTPGESPRLVGASVGTFLLGGLTVFLGYWWSSPFSPVMYASGASFLLFPWLRVVHTATLAGSVARGLIYLPGAMYLWAIWNVWSVARV